MSDKKKQSADKRASECRAKKARWITRNVKESCSETIRKVRSGEE